MSVVRGLLVVVAVGLVAVACGTDPESVGTAPAATNDEPAESEQQPQPARPQPDRPLTKTQRDTTDVVPPPTPVPSDLGNGAWVISEPPPGFVPVLATDRGDVREVYYQSALQPHDLYDSPIVVTTHTEPLDFVSAPAFVEIEVQGRKGFTVELHGDGDYYGNGVIVTAADNRRWGFVTWSELGHEEELLALAGELTMIGEAEWQRMLRGLGFQSSENISPDATGVVVVDGVLDGQPYSLRAFIPDGYPLDGNDSRNSCYQLTVGTADSAVEYPLSCDARPWWWSVGENALVFGLTTDPSIDTVLIQRQTAQEQPTSDPPIEVTVIHAGGHPSGFYLTDVPADWCVVLITTVSGDEGRDLGQMGPGSEDPAHAKCLDDPGQ